MLPIARRALLVALIAAAPLAAAHAQRANVPQKSAVLAGGLTDEDYAWNSMYHREDHARAIRLLGRLSSASPRAYVQRDDAHGRRPQTVGQTHEHRRCAFTYGQTMSKS